MGDLPLQGFKSLQLSTVLTKSPGSTGVRSVLPPSENLGPVLQLERHFKSLDLYRHPFLSNYPLQCLQL